MVAHGPVGTARVFGVGIVFAILRFEFLVLAREQLYCRDQSTQTVPAYVDVVSRRTVLRLLPNFSDRDLETL